MTIVLDNPSGVLKVLPPKSTSVVPVRPIVYDGAADWPKTVEFSSVVVQPATLSKIPTLLFEAPPALSAKTTPSAYNFPVPAVHLYPLTPLFDDPLFPEST